MCFYFPFPNVPINECTLERAPNAAEHAAGWKHLWHPAVTVILLFTCSNLILNNRPKAITASAPLLPPISILLLSHNIADGVKLRLSSSELRPWFLFFVKQNEKSLWEKRHLDFNGHFFPVASSPAITIWRHDQTYTLISDVNLWTREKWALSFVTLTLLNDKKDPRGRTFIPKAFQSPSPHFLMCGFNGALSLCDKPIWSGGQHFLSHFSNNELLCLWLKHMKPMKSQERCSISVSDGKSDIPP